MPTNKIMNFYDANVFVDMKDRFDLTEFYVRESHIANFVVSGERWDEWTRVDLAGYIKVVTSQISSHIIQELQLRSDRIPQFQVVLLRDFSAKVDTRKPVKSLFERTYAIFRKYT
jgi:hypothetical protein